MGGPMLPAGTSEVCVAFFAVLVAWFFIRFFRAARSVLALTTLPERRKRYQKIAMYSFISAPLVYYLFLFPVAYSFKIPGLVFSQSIGLALVPVFVLYGLINLSRARDVGKLERFYGGEDLKRA